ncbi:hypothetical protein ASG29_08600 [Sphingomonas sp. Leaf412]|uniref:BatA domain-containing protein n=1 Tax=Sphingomonas sp. Leaf412 TaxID=1736370 RepID=UPI0006FD5105|nr:BatA domain-containing protein [Sphingomonas sp. Leaf412]KQT31927.1 hypothetical protein ASG29_08600 [Sphingomonas sp. Leaf412]
MTPALLFPAGLAALAALLLPLLIHLARRTETATTDFAALRWLRERPKPRRRPRFDEWPLLVARLLLLAAIALWFARPVLTGAASDRPRVAVVPGADARGAGEGAVWLAPGFPAIDTPMPQGSVPVVSLVRELDATLPPAARLTVRVPAVIEGADAARPVVSRAIDWRVVPGRMAAPPAVRVAPVPLAVRDGGAVGAAYVRAAARALGSRDNGGADVPLPRAGAVAWFVPGELPAAVRDFAARGNVVLLPVTARVADATTVWRDALGAPVAEAAGVGRGRLIRFVRPLTAAALPALVEADFPDRLAAAIGAPPVPPGRVMARDHAPVRGAAAVPAAAVSVDLRPWLAIAIALLLLVERWLATRRARGVAP